MNYGDLRNALQNVSSAEDKAQIVANEILELLATTDGLTFGEAARALDLAKFSLNQFVITQPSTETEPETEPETR